jgi:hypothetical protein
MTAGLSKAILPICTSISRVKIRESKHNMTHHFVHEIISKYSEKERIGTIVQGFTCLATRTAQNLILEDLEGFPMSGRLINDNQKYANKKLRNSTPNMV